MENFNLVTVTVQSDLAKKLFQSTVNASLKKTNGKNSSFSSSKSPEAGLGVKFLSAGLAACIADLVTYPLDTAKVRLQIQGEGAVATASTGGRTLAYAHSIPTSNLSQQPFKYRGIVGTICTLTKEEGVRALYNGLCPGLQRQMCFASVRIGLYDSVKHFYIRLFHANGVSGQNVGLRVLAGATTGAMAVGCAQPTDVVKVRMQAQPRNARLYSGTINAYNTIATKEGVRGLWKGTLPNVARNAIVNTTELVSYDLIKEAILRRKLLSDSIPCHFLAAFGAGFCTTVLASPVDVVKTRFMNAADGRYRGALHCAAVMYQEGGLRAFYKGFMPSFVRLGSWNIVMFVSYEQLKLFLAGVNGNRKQRTNNQELQSHKKRESKAFELPSATQRYM